MSHIMSTQDLQCTNGAKHRETIHTNTSLVCTNPSSFLAFQMSACGRVSRIKILIAATSLKPTDSPITDSVNKYSLLSTLDLMDF